MAALIGALRVSLSADTANFEAGMRRARGTSNTTVAAISRSLSGLKGAITGFLSGLTVGYFTNVIKQGLDFAASLETVSSTLGVTAKDLQLFQFAATQTGVSQDQLQKGLLKLTVTMGQVAAGAEAPRKALAAIGITADEIKGKDTGQVFRLIADALSRVTDRSQRAAVEVALFGRAGASLDGLLSGGTAALDDLSVAAERLGIVLSDAQIQRAHETAIKLEALKTVLSANIAGAVADNADAILKLGNALAFLVRSIGQAIQGWKLMGAEFNAFATTAGKDLDMSLGDIMKGKLANPLAAANAAAGQQKRAAEWSRILAGNAAFMKAPAVPPGEDIGQFLAPGPKKAKEDHTAEELLRAQFEWAQQMNRAQLDTLHAQQELSRDYVERTTIGIQILNKEKEGFEAELAFNVALHELTKGKQGYSQAQANQLKVQFDITDSLERQKLLQDEQEQRQRDVADLTQHDFDRRQDILKSQEQLATTASERRKIELDLLDIAYEQKRQALQNTIDTSKDQREIEDARRDLVNLNKTYGTDRQGVMNQTRGPLEDWAAHVPQTAAQINEALQSIEVQGLDGLSEAIAGVITGTEKMKDAFSKLAQSIIADLIQMSIKMLIFRALSSIFGSAFGGGVPTLNIPAFGTGINGGNLEHFASGGSFNVVGFPGVDKNLLSLNGVPIANVSHGERINIANDNANSQPVTIHQYNNFAGGAATQADVVKMGVVTKQATIAALRQEARRRS